MATGIRKDAPYKEFAQRLRKLRTEAGLTRDQLGEKIGIAGRSLANYENGERIPYGDTCVRMAEVFGITTDELLGCEITDFEMAKAKALDDVGRIFGGTSANSAQTYLDGTNALLAGGTLPVEDQLDFISVMRKILVDAEMRAKEKFTPNKFKTPEWQERAAAQRDQVDAVIRDADEEMADRASLREELREDDEEK